MGCWRSCPDTVCASPFCRPYMREIYQVLISLEPMAVELLARRRPSDDELAPLIKACTAMERALAGRKPNLKAWAPPTSVSQQPRNLWQQRLAGMIMRSGIRLIEPHVHAHTASIADTVDAGTPRCRRGGARGDVAGARELYAAHRRRGGIIDGDHRTPRVPATMKKDHDRVQRVHHCPHARGRIGIEVMEPRTRFLKRSRHDTP